MYFAKNLRYLRRLKEWSQEYMSDKLGYKSFTTIQKWESGDSEPSMSKIRSICIMFNIPIEQMLNCDLETEADEILYRIKSLLRELNLQHTALTQYLDIADISYNEWQNHTSKSYIFYLSEIADFFGISIDSLTGRLAPFWGLDGEQIELASSNNISTTIINNKEDDTDTTTSEYKLLNKYRILDDDGKEFVDLVLNREYDRCQSLAEVQQIQEENAEYNVIYFPFPDNSASAGFGDEFLSDTTETIAAIANRQTIRADFVIRVNGNSMSPLFEDGDIVLVHQQPAVDIGAIGLYAIDGKGYIKKQGEDRLISVNEDYDDIEPNEFSTFKCFGEVIGKLEPEWII